VQPKNPYIDLHLHLDGAITLPIAKRLAALQDIELPAKTDEELIKLLSLPNGCESLNDFLKCFAFPGTLLQTKEGIREAVRMVIEEAAANGAVYVEVRFAPQLHTNGIAGRPETRITMEDSINAAIEGLNLASIKANLILCLMRGEGNEEANLETIELAKKYLVEDGGMTALDLAGAEGLYPTEKYEEMFRLAKSYGIPFTIHAGEAAGPESARAAIKFGASRIGHGTRVFRGRDGHGTEIGQEQDALEVARLLKENRVTVEMCFTSNLMTKACDSQEDFPIRKYLEMGIPVTINTDDPAIEVTTIDREFALVRETFGLTIEEEKQLLLSAVDAAFMSDEAKKELSKQIKGTKK